MLVISRKKNESILVTSPEGDMVEISVVEIRGDKVRFGIVAPREWGVCRRETWDANHPKSEPVTPPGGTPPQS